MQAPVLDQWSTHSHQPSESEPAARDVGFHSEARGPFSHLRQHTHAHHGAGPSGPFANTATPETLQKETLETIRRCPCFSPYSCHLMSGSAARSSGTHYSAHSFTAIATCTLAASPPPSTARTPARVTPRSFSTPATDSDPSDKPCDDGK